MADLVIVVLPWRGVGSGELCISNYIYCLFHSQVLATQAKNENLKQDQQTGRAQEINLIHLLFMQVKFY